MSEVVKREGQRPTESFSSTKLHASVFAACLSVRSPVGEAEMTALSVCSEVAKWLQAKPEVTSSDLRRKATETLARHHPEAAYLYQHHRMVL